MVFENLAFLTQGWIEQFGYMAVFIGSIITTSLVLFPTSTLPVIILAVSLGLNPFIVGILAGIGFAIGQLTGYLIGFGGTTLLQKYRKKTPKLIKRVEKLFIRFRFWFILVYSALPIKPIPFDVIGILSGLERYESKNFILLQQLVIS